MYLNKKKLYFFLSVVLFRLLLETSYYLVVSPIYSYSGFKFNFSLINYLISWLLLFFSLSFTQTTLKKVSDIFFTLSICLIICPLTVLYGYNFELSILPVISTIAFLFLASLIVKTNLFPKIKTPTILQGKSIAIFSAIAVVLLLIIRSLISNVNLNLDLSKIYEFRSINAEEISSGIFAYITNWTYKVFNPFLIVICLFYRRFLSFFILLGIQLYFFAITAHKSVLFFPIVVIGIWCCFRKNRNLNLIFLGFSAIIFTTLVSFFLFHDIWITSLFSRRTFFVPANLTFVYFDFFSNNPHTYWSNSIFKYFLEYPYDISLARVIGRHLESDSMSANNGAVSTGFAHAGLWGVCLYSIITGFILKIIDSICHKKFPIWFSLSLFSVSYLTILTSSDLFTSLATHGLILVIILTFLLRKNNHNYN